MGIALNKTKQNKFQISGTPGFICKICPEVLKFKKQR